MYKYELKTKISSIGIVHIPEEYREIYGQTVNIVILQNNDNYKKKINPMDYSNTLDWPVDGMDYQTMLRNEWE